MYDFRCSKCNHNFERLIPLKYYEHPTPCPLCESDSYNVISAPNIVRAGTLFDRRKVPSDFKDGVLGRMKKFYNSSSDTIKI